METKNIALVGESVSINGKTFSIDTLEKVLIKELSKRGYKREMIFFYLKKIDRLRG